MASYVNGCRTANMGIVETIDGVEVEILSHLFHNPGSDIVCTYYYDSAKGCKVEVTYYKGVHDSAREGHEIYFFDNLESVQHYYSRVYAPHTIPTKYAKIAEQLRSIHSKIDFNKYKGWTAHE